MGLTRSSTGSALSGGERGSGRVVALAGNPNVGKSTIFNALTGLHQHTGNWPGKTVGSAYGTAMLGGESCVIADTPGAYSLAARSHEEELARDALLFGGADTVVAVCDATNLRRSLALALQIREFAPKMLLCLSLMDEAEKNGIHIDLERLSERTGLPVAAVSARRGEGLEELRSAIAAARTQPVRPVCCGCGVEDAIRPLCEYFEAYHPPLPAHWLAMRVLEGDGSTISSLERHFGMDASDPELSGVIADCRERLDRLPLGPGGLSDLTARRLGELASAIYDGCVSVDAPRRRFDVDAVLTHPVWSWPVMLLLLAAVLWLTVSGANYPSALLSRWLLALVSAVSSALRALGLPEWPVSLLCDGALRTCAWVVSVMLPPMAIFFPLFTLLEDLGYLPRVAFNLDGFFKGCGACGKQALTMCMGFGCNAAGVVGCRIIDSPRERLIAVLTNSLVPCNGRFPTMIAVIGIFLAGSGPLSSLRASAILTGFVVLGVAMTLLSSRLLTKTLLRGESSSFTLELPPYRRPRVGEIIVRSILDRTLFVLARAIKAAAPAGALIWLLGNVSIGGAPLLLTVSRALDGPAGILGLDGAILLGFILGLPANEIVVPVMLMCYLSGGSLEGYSSLAELRGILLANGWTASTALCMLLFTLMHWPCATTLQTIKKETGSALYTAVAALLPTVFGMAFCMAVHALSLMI